MNDQEMTNPKSSASTIARIGEAPDHEERAPVGGDDAGAEARHARLLRGNHLSHEPIDLSGRGAPRGWSARAMASSILPARMEFAMSATTAIASSCAARIC